MDSSDLDRPLAPTLGLPAMSRRTALRRLGAGGLAASLLLTDGRSRVRVAAQDATATADQDQDQDQTGALAVRTISLDQAQRVIEAAAAKAQDLDTKMDIAVVDAATHLKAFVRMDGARLGSIDVALKKARTAALFEMPSGNFGPAVQPGQPLYGAELSNDGLITFAGGIPLTDGEGATIGAIGVSGSSVENDQAVAEAGAAALAETAARGGATTAASRK